MPIRNVTQGNVFTVGFFGGLLFFLGLNYYDMVSQWYGLDMWGQPGIPFPFIRNAGGLLENMLWLWLLADIVFAVAMSFCIGVTAKAISENRSK